MAKASVLSVEALEALDNALARFAEKAHASLESATSAIERGIDILEGRRLYWSRQVSYWQEEYNSADPEEDDLSTIAFRLQEAEEQLENVERWQSRVEDCIQIYSRQESQLDEIASGQVLEARAFLQRKIELLRAWAATPISTSDYSRFTGSNPVHPDSLVSAPRKATSTFASAAMPLENARTDYTDIPLPEGFRWVNLDEIDPKEMDQLPSESEFRKVEYKEVLKGFETLRDEILPILRESPQNANSDYFWYQDRQRDLNESNGAQKVFNAFFGSDYMYLERRKGDRYFSITNGRHRIRVARDIGWQTVPVRANVVG